MNWFVSRTCAVCLALGGWGTCIVIDSPGFVWIWLLAVVVTWQDWGAGILDVVRDWEFVVVLLPIEFLPSSDIIDGRTWMAVESGDINPVAEPLREIEDVVTVAVFKAWVLVGNATDVWLAGN